jgi:hypothetical protein
LVAKAVDTANGDYLMTVPAKALDIDLMANHTDRKSNSGKVSTDDQTLPNPNKSIHSKKLSSMCYKEGLVQARKRSDSSSVSPYFGYHLYVVSPFQQAVIYLLHSPDNNRLTKMIAINKTFQLGIA